MAGNAGAHVHLVTPLGRQAEGLVQGGDAQDPAERDVQGFGDPVQHVAGQPVILVLDFHQHVDQVAGLAAVFLYDLIYLVAIHDRSSNSYPRYRVPHFCPIHHPDCGAQTAATSVRPASNLISPCSVNSCRWRETSDGSRSRLPEISTAGTGFLRRNPMMRLITSLSRTSSLNRSLNSSLPKNFRYPSSVRTGTLSLS